MPLIGVIIPVYNVEKYLEECINSVLNQSFKDIEVILVDDGSTDNSGKICDYYKEKDSRVKVIHKENGGLSDARNEGIRIAISKYILFLDSDDYWIDNSLNEISKCANNEVDVVFLTATKLFNYTNIIEEKFEELEKSKILNKSQSEVFIYLASLNKFPVSACTKLVRRDFILDNNLFFQKGLLSEDIEWSTRVLLAADSYDSCNSKFYIYRKQGQSSITNSVNLKGVRDLLYIIKKWTNKCKKDEIKKELKKPLLALYAYEYSILLAHLYSISKGDRDDIYKEVNELKWILKYSNCKKTNAIKLLVYILGIKKTGYVLNKYINIHSK